MLLNILYFPLSRLHCAVLTAVTNIAQAIGKKFTWDVVSPPHDLQDDNNSCGVFVMQAQAYM